MIEHPALPQPTDISAQPWLQISCSDGFIGWLTTCKISLALSTYQVGKLILLGRNAQQQLSVVERTFNRCMGLWGDSQTLWMSTQFQIWKFKNFLPEGDKYQGYDRLFVPQIGYTTGDLDVHDVALTSEGQLVFVNTLFSCLATFGESTSFTPLWKPPHISQLAAEDRCHLNGLATVEGVPRYVTCAALSDQVQGWRSHMRDGGAVLDLADGRVVARGLSMPHSPRYFRDRLWVLNSGRGEFGYVDLNTETFHAVTFCPGYLRGLTLVDNYAIIGLSRPRHGGSFSGLPLDERLQSENVPPRCGLVIIDLHSGDIVEWLWLEIGVDELYDVIALAGVERPLILGFKTDEILRLNPTWR
ncbi:TIGR03032 family protein [Planctomicrobium sp. SH664]|uniref:TIGR03032 family protein n=1 Tax=Planctomicrobium sp. SH664 TaxID=3448125 RepID=UPI003F5BD0B0